MLAPTIANWLYPGLFLLNPFSLGGDPHSIRLTGLVRSLLGVLGVWRVFAGHEQPGLAVLPPLPPPVVCGGPPPPAGSLHLLRPFVPPLLPRAGPCSWLLHLLLITVQAEAVALARSGGRWKGGQGIVCSATLQHYSFYLSVMYLYKSWSRTATGVWRTQTKSVTKSATSTATSFPPTRP